MSFAEKLGAKKDELNLTQKEMCEVLFGVPHRTLQSWLQGEKAPPDYMISLIYFRLECVRDGGILVNTDKVLASSGTNADVVVDLQPESTD